MRDLERLGRGGRLLLALAVGGAVFGIATAVQASIPGAHSVIHGCYSAPGAKATGGTTLNILNNAKATCGKRMRPIAWDQEGVKGAKGETGTIGPKGAKGASGPTGPAGISGYEIVRASTQDPPNTTATAQAVCPTGKKVIGGAGSVQGVPTGVWLHTNATTEPSGGPSYYDVIGVNTTATTVQLNSVAICAIVN
jgi:hypothetical protein